MKGKIALIVLAAVLVLAGSLLWQGRQQEAASQSGATSTALGLMLLEQEAGAGLYVLAVTQESPADRAGIHPGDYLLQSEGVQLQTSAQLDTLINAAQDVLPLTLRRDGQQLQVGLSTR